MEDISLHILDIMQNSIVAGATAISLSISADPASGLLELCIGDNGKGMDKELLKKASDPFVTHRTTRRVGMGLPLLKDSAEMAEGLLELSSEPGKGTEVRACFGIGHIDRLPLGDLSETIIAELLSYPGLELELTLSSKKGRFEMKTSEIKATLDGVPITELNIITWIKEYINDGIKEIFGGVLDEIDS
ncbi:MAG: ATP-binding protein [Clostridiales bacterium]|nr:ATP-binding protein [Clostridiales bacterium]